MTGLHWACKYGHEYVCKILIENNSDINALDFVYSLFGPKKQNLIFFLMTEK